MDRFGFPLPDLEDLHARSMTADEKRGFSFACQTIQLWATQIENSAVNLAGHGQTIPLDQHIIKSARTAGGMADALDRTIGR